MQNEPYDTTKPGEPVFRDYLAEERTILANERTFLAYLRTALAFAGGGVSLIQFVGSLIADITGVILIVVAAAIFFIGIWRYIITKRYLDSIYKKIATMDTSSAADKREDQKLERTG